MELQTILVSVVEMYKFKILFGCNIHTACVKDCKWFKLKLHIPVLASASVCRRIHHGAASRTPLEV